MDYTFFTFISYKNLYPNTQLDIDDCLSGFTREQLFSLYVNYRSNFCNEEIMHVLDALKSDKPWPFYSEINHCLAVYHKREKKLHPLIEDGRNCLLTNISLLELLRRFMAIPPGDKKISDLEAHERFVKAILLVNEYIFDVDIDEKSINSTDIRTERVFITNNFSFYSYTALPFHETTFCELVRFTDFQEFCKSNMQYNKYFTDFLETNSIKNKETYAIRYFSILMTFSRAGKHEILNLSGNYEPFNKIDINDIIPLNLNEDYKRFREIPLIKLRNNDFLLIDESFLLGKIFSSLVFSLIPFSGQTVQTFFGNYDKLFSEEVLMRKYIKQSFKTSHKAIRLDDDEMKMLQPIISGQVDYYIRIKNCVFLIEYKDVRISAKYRKSRKYKDIEKALFEKFDEIDGKRLGVNQLAYNACQILNGTFTFDKEIKTKKIQIYPILLIHDSQFNLHGLNTLLGRKFRERLSIRTYQVRDLTVMDLNTFIKYAEKMANGSIDFRKAINGYHRYMYKLKSLQHGSLESALDIFNSFSMYMDRHFTRKHLLKKVNQFRDILVKGVSQT